MSTTIDAARSMRVGRSLPRFRCGPAIHAGHEDHSGAIARQMGKWVDQVLGQSYQQYCPGEAWKPAVNIYEDDRGYVIVADLAGMKAADVDLRAEPGKLVISGERAVPHYENTKGDVRLHTMEIDHGRFCRAVNLPEDADIDAIEALYRNGYLWIQVPKVS